MNSRERAFAAIDLANPDRIPTMHQCLPAALQQHGDALRQIWSKYPQDFGDLSKAPAPLINPKNFRKDGSYYAMETDDWGVVWECRVPGILGHPIRRPFDDISKLDSYRPPEPRATEGAKFEADLQDAKEHKKKFYLRQGWISIFEVMHAMRHFEDVLMDIYDDTISINRLADMITEYMLKMIEYYIALGVDGIQFGDDFGTQQSLLFDLDTWRRFFKPRYAKLMEPIKQAGKHIFFHSCGHTLELVDEFADLGVNVFWPQLNVNNNRILAKRCRQNRICLMLHLDRQKLLPFGTPEQIDREVQLAVKLFADSTGGVILYGEIDNDFPLTNIVALYKAFEKYSVNIINLPESPKHS